MFVNQSCKLGLSLESVKAIGKGAWHGWMLWSEVFDGGFVSPDLVSVDALPGFLR